MTLQDRAETKETLGDLLGVIRRLEALEARVANNEIDPRWSKVEDRLQEVERSEGRYHWSRFLKEFSETPLVLIPILLTLDMSIAMVVMAGSYAAHIAK